MTGTPSQASSSGHGLGPLLLGLCALLSSWFAPSLNAAPQVHLLVPENTGLFRELYFELDRRLKAQDIELGLVELGHSPPALPKSTIWIAAGPQSLALALAARSDTPILSLLNTREAVDTLQRQGTSSAPLSALYHDPDPARQLRLARALLPRMRNLGLLLGPGREGERKELEALAQAAGITLNLAVVAQADTLMPNLNEVLGRSDALLAVPDGSVINRHSLKTILLTAYRQNRVLIGYSERMVTAGSLATTYSLPAQSAEQASTWLIEALKHRPLRLPPPAYSRDFKVAVNRQVARSLNLTLPDTIELEKLLMAAESAQAGVVKP